MRWPNLISYGEMRAWGEVGAARGGRSCFVVESKSF